jgi:hypothetical protein
MTWVDNTLGPFIPGIFCQNLPQLLCSKAQVWMKNPNDFCYEDFFWGWGTFVLFCFWEHNSKLNWQGVGNNPKSGSVAKHKTIFSWQGFRPFTSGFEPLYGTKQDLYNWPIALGDLNIHDNVANFSSIVLFMKRTKKWSNAKTTWFFKFN